MRNENLPVRPKTDIRAPETPQEGLEVVMEDKDDMEENPMKEWALMLNTKRRERSQGGREKGKEKETPKTTIQAVEASMTHILEAIASSKSLESKRRETSLNRRMMTSNSQPNQPLQNKRPEHQSQHQPSLNLKSLLPSSFLHHHRKGERLPKRLARRPRHH